MRKTLLLPLSLALLGAGCQRLLVRTDNKVAIVGPVDTRVVTEIPPVTAAGPVRPVWVGGPRCGPRVAVVDVDGLQLNTPFVGLSSLGENPVSLFREKLDAAACDPQVKAVVLRINSPGGGVAACTVLRADLQRFKARTGKPVVACLMDQAAGGAYALASAADAVVAGPATVTGGIGVVLNLYNLRDLMAQFNVVNQSVKAGPNLDVGSSGRALTEEDKQLLQTMADEYHAAMRAAVFQSRPRIDAAGGTTYDGRVFTATQALARGLIDYVGDLDFAVELAGQLGCLERPTESQVVLYRRTNDPAHSMYAVSANVPLQGSGLLPSVPGLDRTRLPTFLSLWQPELTVEKLAGK